MALADGPGALSNPGENACPWIDAGHVTAIGLQDSVMRKTRRRINLGQNVGSVSLNYFVPLTWMGSGLCTSVSRGIGPWAQSGSYDKDTSSVRDSMKPLR